MKVFFDSSSLAKRYLKEVGSDKVDQILSQSEKLFVSTIVYPEILSALNRTLRDNKITSSEYRLIKKSFTNDLMDMNTITVDQNVAISTEIILEKSVMRGMDAIHISCALLCKPDLFVSSDDRQLEAAKLAGLDTEKV